MSGCTTEEQMGWRLRIEKAIRELCTYDITFVHPPLFFNYQHPNQKSETEILEWEMAQIRDSDIVIVNLDGIESSIGTHMELAYTKAINDFGSKHISVLALGDESKVEHPWLKLSYSRVEDNIEDAADYVVYYLLV